MRRRAVLTVLAALPGCVFVTPTGTATVVVTNADRVSHPIAVTVSRGGRVVAETGTGELAPSDRATFELGGVEAGSYSLRVAATDADAAAEWRVKECPNLHVDATVGPDGRVSLSPACS